MGHQTGENEQGLRKTLDFTRLLSVSILTIELYNLLYAQMQQLGLTSAISDRILMNITKLFVFRDVLTAKGYVILLLAISLMGAKGKKSETISLSHSLTMVGVGCLGFFLIDVFNMNLTNTFFGVLYVLVTGTCYLMILSGGTRLSRLLTLKLNGDIFNSLNETFPQEERLLTNELSMEAKMKQY